jgi:mRNA interferase RelE/StbE
LAWTIEFTPASARAVKKIDPEQARRILRFLREKAANDPRGYGKPLRGVLREFWRYRVGKYRILARLHDARFLILVVWIGHRKEMYRE